MATHYTAWITGKMDNSIKNAKTYFKLSSCQQLIKYEK